MLAAGRAYCFNCVSPPDLWWGNCWTGQVMGLRELLILVLILAIVGAVLRGLYVALRSRRGHIKIALDKNIPEYDLEEIEMRELPSGGARLVERSFAEVMKQSNAQNVREADSRVVKPAPSPKKAAAAVRRDDDIPVLTEKVEEAELSTEPSTKSGVDSEAIDDDQQRAEPAWNDDRDSLDAQVFVDDYSSEDDEDDDFDDDYGEEYGDDVDEGDDEDDLDDELDDALTRSSWLDDPVAEPEPSAAELKPEPEPAPPVAGTESSETEDIESEPYTEAAHEADDADDVDVNEYFGAATDDDFDVLLEGYDDERSQRLEQIEAQQETASRKLASWAGQKMDRLSTGAGSLLRASREKRAHSHDEKRAQLQEAARREEVRQNELDLDAPEQNDSAEVAPASEKDHSSQERSGTADESRPTANNNVDQEYSEVLVLNVMAHEDELIQGDDLLPVLLAAGLRFGEMNIFHRHAGGKSGPVLFSVANVLNPGTFDLNSISEFSTKGLCFFLTLPNVINNMQAFDEMLRTAQQLCDGLDAELKDDNRSVMTAQTIEHYRERIRNFELRQLRGGR